MQTKYNLFKAIKKTESQNETLQLIENRQYDKILIDTTYLNNYNIPDDVKNNIIKECKNLSPANTTLFVGYVQDFKAYDGILKFQCIKVLKDNGCKHCYNIFVLKNIDRLNYGERSTVYNQFYNENKINIEENNRIESIIDLEIA